MFGLQEDSGKAIGMYARFCTEVKYSETFGAPCFRRIRQVEALVECSEVSSYINQIRPFKGKGVNPKIKKFLGVTVVKIGEKHRGTFETFFYFP